MVLQPAGSFLLAQWRGRRKRRWGVDQLHRSPFFRRLSPSDDSGAGRVYLPRGGGGRDTAFTLMMVLMVEELLLGQHIRKRLDTANRRREKREKKRRRRV